MIYDQVTQGIQNNLQEYATLNECLSTSQKINKPSDDVSGLSQAMDYNVSISANNQYSRNISEASSQLGNVNTVLSTVSSTLQQVQQDAVSAANGVLDSTTQPALAQDTAQLRDQLLSLGNTQIDGQYIFSGRWTNQNAFDTTTYAYQGDTGNTNVQIDSNTVLPENIPGSTAFSYTLSAPETVQLSGGQYVQYTPGAGTTVNVEILDTDDTTVLDTFSFSNIIQMTDTLSSAISDGDTLRIQALVQPFQSAVQQVTNVQADVGALMSRLNNQTTLLTNTNENLSNSLSNVMNDDTAQISTELTQSETVLTALRESASQVLSNSLLDFLK